MRRRFRVPKAVVLHHADILKSERVAIGAIPITNVYRTIGDGIDRIDLINEVRDLHEKRHDVLGVLDNLALGIVVASPLSSFSGHEVVLRFPGAPLERHGWTA
jgi:hypothetical protein